MSEGPTILMGRPVNLNDQERRVSVELGFDMSDPYPGSVQKPCVDCGREVWVGPRQQAALAQLDDVVICCPTDAVSRTANQDYLHVSLGNKHPRESS